MPSLAILDNTPESVCTSRQFGVSSASFYLPQLIANRLGHEMKKSATFLDRLLGSFKAPSDAHSDLVFGTDFLAQLERLRVAALKALGGGLREGHRLGAYKGGQLEFHGHRDYSPGDELRYLDWNSYARLDRPYIKEFAREEAGVLHILIDGTKSMNLGAPSKRIFALRVAALFAHVALSSKDAVNLLVFKGGGKHEQFPRRNSKTTTQACLTFLQKINWEEAADAEPAPTEAQSHVLRDAVSEFLKQRPRRGGVLIVGDFWQDESEVFESVARLTQAGFDPSALHILADEEIKPAVDGELWVHSEESQESTALWFGAGTSARYGEELERHQNAIEHIFRKRGGNYLFASSGTSIEKVLIATLRQRRWLI